MKTQYPNIVKLRFEEFSVGVCDFVDGCDGVLLRCYLRRTQ